MQFILQSDSELNIENHIVKDLIKADHTIHSYVNMTHTELCNASEKYSSSIPIGTIEFVETWLKKFHGIEKEIPIEIPSCLRTWEFLKRNYAIVPWNEIPFVGRYFIKDVSQLKRFSYVGDVKYMPISEIDKTHLYQLSEEVVILSEYRIYVIDGKIEDISYYNGNPLILPDINLISKANEIFKLQKGSPRSYTIDVMVTPAGTSLIEIHNFTSVGLYSTIWGTNLLWAYRDGIDYLLNREQNRSIVHNTEYRTKPVY